MTTERAHERRGLYRSRNGVILGVCRGLGNYMECSAAWVRVFVLIVMLCTALWPTVAIYLLAALLMRPEPVLPFQTHEDREFYDSYVNSRSMAVQRLKRTRQNLERRLQRLEHMVTAKEFDWESRLNDSPGNG